MDAKYDYASLKKFGTELLAKSGMTADIASIVAEVLVEGDLLGKSTHGMQLLSPYLKSIAAGDMTLSGEIKVLKEAGGNTTLDANYLPGPYVIKEAIERAIQKMPSFGIVSTAIQRCHHIACLQAYLKPVTDLGYAIILTCSDPSVRTVAPYGGVKPAFTPNPFAVGIPTEAEPILIDISASSTTNGRSMQLNKEGKKFSSDCLMSSEGEVTNDPAVLFEDPPGTILPLGGVDFGHKGFALALLVEMLTSGLGGHGRSHEPTHWGASVFVQLIDPEFFGGIRHFKRETTWLSNACRAAGKEADSNAVRMPGGKGLEMRAAQLKHGVVLYPAIMPPLEKWAEKLNVEIPVPKAT